MRLRSVTAALCALAACEVPGDPPATARSRTRSMPGCDAPSTAAIRTGEGVDATRCTPVGAAPAGTEARWADVTDAPAPVVFVDPSSAGGDGSRERPFPTLAAALGATPRPLTVALSRGEHRVEGVNLDASLTLRGAGVAATTVRAAGRFALSVTGAATRATVSGLTVRSSAPGEGALVEVSEATLVLRDVAVEGGGDGLRASDATVEAEGLTLRGATRHGLFATGRGAVALTRFAVTDHGAQGIRLDGPHAHLAVGLVARNGRHGAVLTGAVDATGGRAECFGAIAPGRFDCIDRVSFDGNGVAGLFLAGGRLVEGRRLLVADTRLVTVVGGAAGDGLAVTDGASIALDPDLRGVARRGWGSAFVGNARAGVVAQGTGASLALHAALCAANRAGGVILTAGAVAPTVRDSLFESNQFGGLVATPGTVVGVVQCNGIFDSRDGTLQTTAGPVTLGDGLHLNGATGAMRLVDNEVSSSSRFGLLLNAARASAEGNRGTANRYGVGVYNRATLEGDASAIVGRETVPPRAPAVVDGL